MSVFRFSYIYLLIQNIQKILYSRTFLYFYTSDCFIAGAREG